jgi:hypothetical protein
MRARDHRRVALGWRVGAVPGAQQLVRDLAVAAGPVTAAEWQPPAAHQPVRAAAHQA